MASSHNRTREQLISLFVNTVDRQCADKGKLKHLDALLSEKDRDSYAYQIVMIILLDIWPKELQERVATELRQLKDQSDASGEVSEKLNELELSKKPNKEADYYAEANMDQYTLMLWYDLNVCTYYNYVKRHKHYVSLGYHYFNAFVIGSVKQRLREEKLLLDEYKPDEDPTDEQIAEHDDSKYCFEEAVTYAMRWYSNSQLGKWDEAAWQKGLNHHYCTNKHHPENWGTSPMQWRYIVEAMYDMSAMELERKFKGELPENKAELLVFDPRFLTRFEVTGQLHFIKTLTRYTILAYCSAEGLKVPAMPDS